MARNEKLDEMITTKAKTDAGYAIALLQVASAQDRTATHLKYLGVGDAATTMGAIEFLTVTLGDKLGALALACQNTAP
jgi:hypothetical protein